MTNVVPKSGRKRGSSGCATSATQLASSSGRVVSIVDGAVVVGAVKGDAVIGAGLLAVLQFGLGDGHPKVHVPERGGHAQSRRRPSRSMCEEGRWRDCPGVLPTVVYSRLPVDADAEAAKEVFK